MFLKIFLPFFFVLLINSSILFGQTLPTSPEKNRGRIDLEQNLGKKISLDLPFADEEGKTLLLKDLIHKPTILSLVYFNCPGICTPLLNELQKRLEVLGLKPGEEFQILTISFDPTEGPSMAREKRKAYLKRFKRSFPPEAWRFLTGKKENIKKLTGEVGFHYRKEGKQYRHAGGLIILSPTGKITRYLYGIEYLPADLQMALQKAKKGIVEPAIPKAVVDNKTKLFCFVVDPNGKIIGLKITNIAMIAIALMVFGFGIFIFFKRSRLLPERKR